ncbi:hypothetical protein ABPG72_000321 [Tetrahymena utriculariae]
MKKVLKNFDAFSESMQFNASKQSLKKRTLLGAFLTINSKDSFITTLDVIRCQNPQLKSLNCFDFSKLPNQCQDTDVYKRFTPNNCVKEKQINDLINKSGYFLNINLKASQYNTTKQEIQDQYRSQLYAGTTSQSSIADFRIQNHITNLKKCFIIQQEESFTSPILYTTQTQNYNHQQCIQDTGFSFISFITFEIDENKFYFHIQYPMFTVVLALCNSTLALMIFLCSFCRQMPIKQIQSEKQQGIGEGQDDNTKIGQIVEDIIEAESKNDFAILQFQPNFCEKFGINSKIRQSVKETNEELMKYPGTQTKHTNNEEILFKKQDNLSGLIYQQSLIALNTSCQDQIANHNRYDSYQKSSQLYQLDFKQKLILKNSSNSNKIKQTKCQIDLMKLHQNKRKIQMCKYQVNRYTRVNKCLMESNYPNNKILQKRDKTQTKQILRKMEQQIDDSLDFFIFFKEILFLKKVALILLNKDQLAAIQLVGLDIEDIQPKSYKIQNDLLGEDYCLNYIKEQFEILQSTELQSQYIKIFLQKCQSKQALDPIEEKRILSQLIINKDHQINQNKLYFEKCCCQG